MALSNTCLPLIIVDCEYAEEGDSDYWDSMVDNLHVGTRIGRPIESPITPSPSDEYYSEEELPLQGIVDSETDVADDSN